MKRAAFLLSAAFLQACGGGGATAPTSPASEGAASVRSSSAGTASAATAALTFVSGETDAPVAGAAVTLGGRSFTTDAEGQISFTDTFSPTTQLEVMAGGFLRRETLLRSDTRFSLWPDREGFDASFTREVLYFPGFVIDAKLTRPEAPVFVVLQGDLKDPEIVRAHEEGAAMITAANGGRIPYTLNDAPPAGAIVVTASFNPADPFFAQNPGAVAKGGATYIGNSVKSGVLVFKELSVAKVRNLVAHELGHTFGLGHPTPRGIMNAIIDPSIPDFSDAEKLAMRMSLQRRPANALPDNDRAVQAASRGTAVVVCGLAR